MAVEHYEKTEIRDLLKIAYRRGLRISPPTTEELNSPSYIADIRRRLGRYPNERAYQRAKRIADHLRMKLTEAQRMNREACARFIQTNRDRVPDQPPTPLQIALGRRLAVCKDIFFPPECEESWIAWDRFMSLNLTEEDRDIVHEMECRLALGRGEQDSYGHKVRALEYAKRYEADQTRAVAERIDEMLARGCDVEEISEALDIDLGIVLAREGRLPDDFTDD